MNAAGIRFHGSLTLVLFVGTRHPPFLFSSVDVTGSWTFVVLYINYHSTSEHFCSNKNTLTKTPFVGTITLNR